MNVGDGGGLVGEREKDREVWRVATARWRCVCAWCDDGEGERQQQESEGEGERPSCRVSTNKLPSSISLRAARPCRYGANNSPRANQRVYRTTPWRRFLPWSHASAGSARVDSVDVFTAAEVIDCSMLMTN